MALRIEEYGLIGDTQAAALVGRNGSIDWLCLPRFDSAACFAALLGDTRNGHWSISATGEDRATSWRYRDDSLVLETLWRTATGTVRVVDFMPPRQRDPDVIRVVEGVEGTVEMTTELVVRFGDGRTTPWLRRLDRRLSMVAGPDAVVLECPLELTVVDGRASASFRVAAGDRVPFVLEWHASHEPFGDVVDADQAEAETEAWWRRWSAGSTPVADRWDGAVRRSLTTLKALTFAPTGGIVAAPTTSLPEQLGGVRNWDYRYCWLRDATLTLQALLVGGHRDEAVAWRDWLLRSVAGAPEDLQLMYGVAGERRLPELTLPWLSGYEGSTPVRVGNAAAEQFQLDVFGEVMDALHQARCAGIAPDPSVWELQRALMEFLESNWRRPDEGIWEVRGPRQDFTHSKVLAWVAADRAVHAVERFGLDGPVEQFRRLRAEIHDDVCRRAFDADRGTFTQSYGSVELDAACLLIPAVGFLPASDERVAGTVAAIERELCVDGFVHRYRQLEESVDGLPGGEGAFLACTFWLADAYVLLGRHADAVAAFERVLAVRTDLGLLAEEYDTATRRLVGNFPQAFSHLPLVTTAHNLSGLSSGPAHQRAQASP